MVCTLLGSYIATMGRRGRQEAGGAGAEVIHQLVDPRTIAEEKLRLAAFRQEQEAFAAPTAARGSSSFSVHPNGAPTTLATNRSLASLLE